jgi:hypothetical protein
MWEVFTDLTPAQQIAAQLQLDKINEPIAKLRRPENRDFLIVDGAVKGSRVRFTDKAGKVVKSLCGDTVRSKTDLLDWKSTPTPFTMTHD